MQNINGHQDGRPHTHEQLFWITLLFTEMTTTDIYFWTYDRHKNMARFNPLI
jgi:hypothetical protein